MEKIISILGMHCAGCATKVEKNVRSLERVSQADVNLATESLYVVYNDDSDYERIVQAIEATGYRVAVSDDDKKQEQRAFLNRTKLSVLLSVPILYLAMGSHLFHLPMPHIFHNHFIMGLTQGLLSLPIIWVNRHYYTTGFRQLVKRQPNMDSLVALSTLAAFLQGLYAIVVLSTGQHSDIYIESGAIILALVTLGKYFEHIAKQKTNGAIKALLELTPKKVGRLVDGKVEQLPIEMVKVGDVIRVTSGDYIALDGVVIAGGASVDESLLTGESLPVEKSQTNEVTGGTLLQSGSLDYMVTRVGKHTTLSQIIQLVEKAQGSKAPIAKLADTISRYFVPLVLLLSLMTLLGWLVVGQRLEFALNAAVSVLVIACPCTLGLATPTALMVGMGRGAKKGILIKNATALEQLQGVHTVMFDKTGTLTHGMPKVVAVFGEDTHWGYLVSSLEGHSNHPLAKALVSYFGEQTHEVTQFKQLDGKGLSGVVNNHTIMIGNEKMVVGDNHFVKEANRYAKQGHTALYVVVDNSLVGLVVVADTIKESSQRAIQTLNTMGIETVMVTGDNLTTAQAIANELGIQQVIAEVMPQDKATVMMQHQHDKKVAMVGDGINDAIALAQSDVGIAIGSGTQVAIESADVILMTNDVMDVAQAIRLSKKTMRTIKMNLFFAFIYNIIGIPIAMGLFYPLLLNPMVAGLAMSLSSISVVCNALLLRYVKID